MRPSRPVLVSGARAGLALAVAVSVSLSLGGCGDEEGAAAPGPGGPAISRTEGVPVAGADGWRWIPFEDAFCTDALADGDGRYRFGRSPTGLAVSWGPPGSQDLVVFLQGGGACWDFFTCGGAAPLLDKTALTGPFGPEEFAREIHARYPGSWIRRENLPAPIRDATVVFVPYCTGDVHGGDRVTTYEAPAGVGGARTAITWHHVGRANVLAFLRRLAPTFPAPRRVVVAGSSAGGFGALANYEAFRAAWPAAQAFLVDDSGPPLAGDAIPPSTRAGWYASWNLGASLDGFCPGCRDDLSQGLRELLRRHPGDRIALVSHLQDEVIRGFFGGITLTPRPALTPMPAATFERELRRVGSTILDPSANGRAFFTAGTGHPTLEDPAAVTSPPPGLTRWIEQMLSGDPAWQSASDP